MSHRPTVVTDNCRDAVATPPCAPTLPSFSSPDAMQSSSSSSAAVVADVAAAEEPDRGLPLTLVPRAFGVADFFRPPRRAADLPLAASSAPAPSASDTATAAGAALPPSRMSTTTSFAARSGSTLVSAVAEPRRVDRADRTAVDAVGGSGGAAAAAAVLLLDLVVVVLTDFAPSSTSTASAFLVRRVDRCMRVFARRCAGHTRTAFRENAEKTRM